ncbi:hypothetical protein M7831_001758 [Campylobacter upsaliensis]|nr:hypothetical protein [Campylobacter upsaliensis]
MKREQGKKASQKRLNLTPFVWGGGARSSKVKQGQARSSKVKQGQARSSKVKRVAEANSPEAVRQIYAKWQGKFKANSSQI